MTPNSHEAYRQEILSEVQAHGLTQNTEELDRLGYTIVHDVAPAESIDELRRACTAAIDATNGVQAAQLLRKGGIFESVVCLPKVLAIAEYMVGKGCLLSQVTALRKSQVGTGRHELSIGIHSDLVGMRDPFGEFPWLITVVFALEDWTAGAGGSTIVPGSHKLQRHPKPGVDGRDVVTLTMPKGSVAIWNGAVHHGNSPRTIPGERVTLHVTYSRIVLRTWEDYSDIARELERRGEGGGKLASLLGANDPFGKNTDHGQLRDKVQHVGTWFRT